MKYLFLVFALLFGLQADVLAQHVSRRAPQRTYRKSTHRPRAHHRTYHRRPRRSTYDRAYNGASQQQEPSAYRGNNTPINDGQRKNKQRNLNYNTNQPLPASNGQ